MKCVLCGCTDTKSCLRDFSGQRCAWVHKPGPIGIRPRPEEALPICTACALWTASPGNKICLLLTEQGLKFLLLKVPPSVTCQIRRVQKARKR